MIPSKLRVRTSRKINIGVAKTGVPLEISTIIIANVKRYVPIP
jgi:hypothetical protein